jgi:hypothetical protein
VIFPIAAESSALRFRNPGKISEIPQAHLLRQVEGASEIDL